MEYVGRGSAAVRNVASARLGLSPVPLSGWRQAVPAVGTMNVRFITG
jgi:hypothetical protein